MKKLLLSLFIAGTFFLFLSKEILAADLNIDCPSSPTACSKTGVDPLFSSADDGYWYPGKSITKTLNLKNSGPETREMAIKGTRTSGSILENVMHISIVGGTTVIWSGSVLDFYDQEKIGVGIFAPGANLDYNFTVFMSSGAGDEYQNKETVFDLTLGFWEDAILIPTPTSAPGGGGGGTVLGTGVSAPVCSDNKPGSAPTLLSSVAGTNSVTLYWSKAASPVSYYLVTYGTTSGEQTYGNPNAGDSNTTSYTVNNLSGNITYYFKVRAGNGCMPGDYSNEMSATPGGVFIEGPATEFIPGVLGTTTEISTTATPKSVEVLGIKNQTSQNKSLPYIFLIFQLIFALFFFFLVLSFYTGAPYVPTRAKSAKRMIELAHISKGAHVYDLGSGDGKLLFLAAEKGAIATGFEINPFLVLFTNIKALFSPYKTRVYAIWKNFWFTDLSQPDVILLYLIPWKMKQLEDKLLNETKPGTKIISNSFIFPNIPCTVKDTSNHVYVFTIPKKKI